MLRQFRTFKNKQNEFDIFRPFDLNLTLKERSEVKSDCFSGILVVDLLYSPNLEALGAILKELEIKRQICIMLLS